MKGPSALEALAEAAMSYQSPPPVNGLAAWEGRPTGAAQPQGGGHMLLRRNSSAENRALPKPKPRASKPPLQFCHPKLPPLGEQPPTQCLPALPHPNLAYHPGTMATNWNYLSTPEAFLQTAGQANAASYSAPPPTGIPGAAPPQLGFTPWLHPSNTAPPPHLSGQQALQQSMPPPPSVQIPSLGNQQEAVQQSRPAPNKLTPALIHTQAKEALQATTTDNAYNDLQSALIEMRQRTQSVEVSSITSTVTSIEVQALAAAHAARERAEKEKAAYIERQVAAVATAAIPVSKRSSGRERKAPQAFDEIVEVTKKKKRGVVEEIPEGSKRGRGRPKFAQTEPKAQPSAVPRQKGRPRKQAEEQISHPVPASAPAGEEQLLNQEQDEEEETSLTGRPSSGCQTANDRRRSSQDKRPSRGKEKTPAQIAAITESRRRSGQLRAWMMAHKQNGLLTRMQRARARLLRSILHTPGCTEFDLRAIHGDDPDTSKALRALSEEGLVNRVGNGVKCSAFTYTMLPLGEAEAAQSEALLAEDNEAQKAMAKVLPKHLLDHWKPSAS